MEQINGKQEERVRSSSARGRGREKIFKKRRKALNFENEGTRTAEEKDQKGDEAENWLKERRSREDYDLEPQAEQEEGMKKYSESKKADSRDGE